MPVTSTTETAPATSRSNAPLWVTPMVKATLGFTLFYSVAVVFFYCEWLFTTSSTASPLAYGAALNLALCIGAGAIRLVLPRLRGTRPLFAAGAAGYAIAFSLLLASKSGTLPWAIYLGGCCAGLGCAPLAALWLERLSSLPGPSSLGPYALGVASLLSVPLSVLVGLAPIPVMVLACALFLIGSLMLLRSLGAMAPLAGSTPPTVHAAATGSAPSPPRVLATPLAYVVLLSFIYGTLDDVAMSSSAASAGSSGIISQVCSIITAAAFLAYVYRGSQRYTILLNASVGIVATGLVFLPFLGYAYNLVLVVLTHIGWEMSLLVSYALALQTARSDRRQGITTAALVFSAPRPFVIAGSLVVTLVARGGNLEFAHMAAIAFALLYVILLALWLLFHREKHRADRELARRDELIRRFVDARNDLYELVCKDLARQHGLTRRETDVLKLLSQGRDAGTIEQALGVSRNTVKGYTKTLYVKLGIHSKQELIDLVESDIPLLH